MDHSREGSHGGKFKKDIFGGNHSGRGFLWRGKLVLGTEGFRLQKEIGFQDPYQRNQHSRNNEKSEADL